MAIITKNTKQPKAALEQPKTKAVAVRTAKTDVGAVSDWEEQLKKYAQRSQKVAEATGAGGNWLTFKGGRLAYRGSELKDNAVELVVLDEVLENLYYEGRFDPDNPATPVCFAFAREVGELQPHDTAPDPQHETCKGCSQNAFGSSDTGKGKACKNVVRLAAIAWGDGSREQIESCELAFAKLPVTSVRNWTQYTKSLLDKTGSGPQRVVTRMSVEPNSKTQFQVTFELVEQVDRKLMPAVMARVIEADKEIIPAQPYQPIEREEAPKKPAAKGKKAKY